ncbi:MAG TPA: hypothetical protein VHL58_10460 [Thermoanaerobaculia bacterium]|nr:hypothetical protein [Thermoanaerobaculia bacterium]
MNATGKVIKGRVEFDGEPLPDGAEVVVLRRHTDEEVELSEEEAAMLDEAIRQAEADPAGGVSRDEFRRQ